MPKLRHTLNEANNQPPKALFIVGPPGSGKTSFLEKLDISGFKTINVDDEFENLLITQIGKTKFTDMSPEELSTAASLMGTARKMTREKEISCITSLENIIYDETGSSSKTIMNKKNELEKLGYKIFMVIMYVYPMTSLIRNSKRDRVLPTSAVLNGWKGTISNISLYKEIFGDNFSVIDNNPKFSDKEYIPSKIKQMFPNPTGKQKSDDELEKLIKQKEQLNKDITELLNINIDFTKRKVAKNKILDFTYG